ncbi:MAG: DUF4402 domain-containing protein [Gammaproteobacteria bacterium]|nr:DUF4402 domain-containing protein [Gammaproteobacteria bacterium]
MKLGKLAIAVGLAVTATMSSSVMAATATSNATANIVTPIAITNTAALDFGSFSHGGAAGTVVVDTAGVRTFTGAITLMGVTSAAAAFDVAGTPSSLFSITLPASTILSNGVDNITIDTFLSNPAVAVGGALDATGAAVVNVGATLNIVGTESTGAYTGSFDVTVDYQ